MNHSQGRRRSNAYVALERLTLIVTVVFVLNGAGSAQDGLVIKDSDMFSQVGAKNIYRVTVADGNPTGELVRTVTDCTRLGDLTIITIQAHFNGKLIEKAVRTVRSHRSDFFQSERSRLPKHSFPLPLEAGGTLTFKTESGIASCKVDSEETIETEAGTFRCLVCLIRETPQTAAKFWIAPRVGIVKAQATGPQAYTILLKEVKKPVPAAPPAGSDVLVNFDPGCDPSSIACPNATWEQGEKDSTRHSTITVDADKAALDTAGSLCWSFHVNHQAWTGGRIMLTGSWAEFVDLTPYDSVSFYVKGLRPGSFAFSIQGIAAGKEGQEYTMFPVDCTTEWKKVTIDLKSEELSKIDLRKTILFGLGRGGSENNDADNVLWIDEITAHRKQ